MTKTLSSNPSLSSSIDYDHTPTKRDKGATKHRFSYVKSVFDLDICKKRYTHMHIPKKKKKKERENSEKGQIKLAIRKDEKSEEQENNEMKGQNKSSSNSNSNSNSKSQNQKQSQSQSNKEEEEKKSQQWNELRQKHEASHPYYRNASKRKSATSRAAKSQSMEREKESKEKKVFSQIAVMETKQDVHGITALHFYDSNIHSFHDIHNLQKAIHLIELDLHCNFICKIEQLQTLTKLKFDFYFNIEVGDLLILNLSSNQITEITGLESLKELEELNLSSNRISAIDVQSLKSQTKLRKLILSYNFIDDLRGLQASCFQIAPMLQHLDLKGNCLADLRQLHHLAHLTSLHQLILQDGTDEKANPFCAHAVSFILCHCYYYYYYYCLYFKSSFEEKKRRGPLFEK
ncbi:hypothetical protein RFI_09984 [Reticulomyxa filosa]|uniref:Uncharacterized protein n=1 Tax=Reticulomyxa filosa TaxID=46433 RepID=X6NP49_RETFI|nr:hypothetical protein RFI_09984 [Reticulomyxa filosa]|eukprot:ETO27147.1 hypothetical protein RFI_09984 [Reticulomyxa filosa]